VAFSVRGIFVAAPSMILWARWRTKSVADRDAFPLDGDSMLNGLRRMSK